MTRLRFSGLVVCVASLLVALNCSAAKASKAEKAPIPTVANGLCVVSGTPNVAYTKVKDVKVAKSTYGSADQIFLELVDKARKLGADAIIGYSGSQRFGFFPWRMVRPVVYGVAVKWSEPSKVSCSALGGKQY